MTLRVRLRLRRPGPQAGWSRGARILFLLVFALAVLLAARSVFGDKGLLEWSRLRAEERRLGAEVAALRRDIGAASHAILALREGGLETERIARESLGMARPGEVIYLLPPPVANPAAALTPTPADPSEPPPVQQDAIP